MSDICEKLQAVADKVTGLAPSNAFFGMQIPANPETDLDLIAHEAKREIKRLREAGKDMLDHIVRNDPADMGDINNWGILLDGSIIEHPNPGWKYSINNMTRDERPAGKLDEPAENGGA